MTSSLASLLPRFSWNRQRILQRDPCEQLHLTATARKDTRKLLISDNATFFVGARKQPHSEPNNFNEIMLIETLQIQNVKWRMNSSSSSNFGGVWERFVLMIKRAILVNLGSD